MSSTDTPGTSVDFVGPSASTLKHIASQLTQWRGMLPHPLQWAEDDPTSFPDPRHGNKANFDQQVDPSLSPQQSEAGMVMFTSDLDSEPVRYPYAYDIQVALLRTRYYYAKYMVYRPFVYKALHYPGQLTREDAEGVAECFMVRENPLLLFVTFFGLQRKS